mgnify:CR=1 FL=1
MQANYFQTKAGLFVGVHFVNKHAQKEGGHQQHEHDHAHTHQAIVGREQIDQHFHFKSFEGEMASLCADLSDLA